MRTRHLRKWSGIVILSVIFIVPAEILSQGAYVQRGVSAFGISGGASFDEDGSGVGLDMGYSINGLMDISAGLAKYSVDESELGFELSNTGVGPSFTFYPLKQSPDVPMSLALGLGYVKQWVSSDALDAANLEFTASSWVFGVNIFSSIQTSPTVNLIPSLGISHALNELKVKNTNRNSSYYGETESDDSDLTTFSFGLGLSFQLPSAQIFFVEPGISANKDNTTFGIDIGFLFETTPNRPGRMPNNRRGGFEQELRPQTRNVIQDETEVQVTQNMKSTMVEGVPAMTTVAASYLANYQIQAIAQMFKVAPQSIKTFRWGLTRVGPEHVHAGSTWYTIHYDGPGFRATETIRVGRSGKILERVKQ